MALRDFFKKKDDEIDPLHDLILSKLRIGYLVDYDMKTWEVTRCNCYDFGEEHESIEWEITSGRERFYLERNDDDDVEWTLSKKLPLGAIECNIRQYIIENDDPPREVICKGKKYYLDESGTGRMFENGGESSKEFVYWDLLDEGEEHFLTIEQWGETEFEAAEGYYVEEYQFTNILPGIREEDEK